MLEKTRKKFIKQYAAAFLEELKTDIPHFRKAGIKLPPIKLYRYFRRNRETGELIAGCYSDAAIVEIYGYTRQFPEELRQIVKHEILHAVLRQLNLPYKDDDDIFLLLAIRYNANPYKLLDYIEQTEGRLQ